MSKNEVKATSSKPKTVKKNQKKSATDDKKPFVHPAETWWGKAVVWFIIFGMVGLVLLSFILALINSQA
jgi:hypothetical protein